MLHKALLLVGLALMFAGCDKGPASPSLVPSPTPVPTATPTPTPTPTPAGPTSELVSYSPAINAVLRRGNFARFTFAFSLPEFPAQYPVIVKTGFILYEVQGDYGVAIDNIECSIETHTTWRRVDNTVCEYQVGDQFLRKVTGKTYTSEYLLVFSGSGIPINQRFALGWTVEK